MNPEPVALPIHPVEHRLKTLGITSVAIVDDAYDPPTRDVMQAEVDDFWARIERDEAALEELRTFGIKADNAAQISDTLLAELWARRDALGALRAPVNEELFGNRLEMLADVRALRECLRELSVEVEELGRDEALTGDGKRTKAKKVIFLDYYLGERESDKAVAVAVATAKRLYEQADKQEKPFIVLMSSMASVEDQADLFRKNSGIIGGLFDFVPKAVLASKAKLYLKLATWALELPTQYKVQAFVDTLVAAAATAATQFELKMRELSFQDYVHIQQLCLQKEGQPLGEYILWLCGTTLSHLALANVDVANARGVLDAVSFGDFVASQRAPSPALTELFSTGIFDFDVGDVGSHPRERDGEDVSNAYYLGLGDLFVKDVTSDVWMVITPECDLAYAPGEKKRPWVAERSLLVIPGTLQPLDAKAEDDGKIGTAFYSHDKKPFRLRWDRRRIRTIANGDVGQQLIDKGYRRRARMRMPYALEIQQEFASNAMRVGLPVAPPLRERVDVRVYYRDGDSNVAVHGDAIRGGALIIRTKEQPQFVLTVECVHKVFDAVEAIAEIYEGQIKPDAEQKTAERTRAKATKLRAAPSEVKGWLPLLTTLQDVPAAGKPLEVSGAAVSIFWAEKLAGKFTGAQPIAIALAPGPELGASGTAEQNETEEDEE